MNIINWVKNNPGKTLAVIVLVLILLNMYQCKHNQIAQKKLEVAEQNILALNDTLRETKNKQGEVEFNKLALLTDKVSNLEKLNADLAHSIKNIKGNVSTIIKGEAKIVHDTTYLDAEGGIENNLVTADFKLDTVYSPGNSRKIKGWTEYDLETDAVNAAITQDEIEMSFVTGIKNLDRGKPEIFLSSPYPGFRATKIDGAVLDPGLFKKPDKQKLITLGLHIGYVPITYSLSNKKIDFNLTRFGVGAGANINLSRLLGK